MRRPATRQMLVAVLGHPAGASEVCLPGAPGAVGLAVRIEVQHDPGDLGPVGAVRFGVEQAEIGDQVLFVIAVRAGALGASSATSGSSGGFCMGELAARLLPPKGRHISALASRPELRRHHQTMVRRSIGNAADDQIGASTVAFLPVNGRRLTSRPACPSGPWAWPHVAQAPGGGTRDASDRPRRVSGGSLTVVDRRKRRGRM